MSGQYWGPLIFGISHIENLYLLWPPIPVLGLLERSTAADVRFDPFRRGLSLGS